MSNLQSNLEIAREHGFELATEDGEDVFRRAAGDGSYWIAFTPSELGFDLATANDHIWNIARLAINPHGGQPARIVVTEQLPLATVLSERDRVPVPTFDRMGDGEWSEIDTFTETAFHGLKGQPNWERFVRVLKEVDYLKPVFADGWDVDMTGGGCTGFYKDDEETGTTWEMAAESGVYAHPDSLEWCVQRTTKDLEGCLGVSITTLSEALRRYRDIPAVEEIEELHRYLDDWEAFDDYLAGGQMKP